MEEQVVDGRQCYDSQDEVEVVSYVTSIDFTCRGHAWQDNVTGEARHPAWATKDHESHSIEDVLSLFVNPVPIHRMVPLPILMFFRVREVSFIDKLEIDIKSGVLGANS